MEHSVIEPSILYFGTPVVLISTLNEDGTANLAPMSSVFWLGRRAVLGLSATSKTTQNLLRTGECVLNLPSDEQAAAVDRLALTTGSDPVPPAKQKRGYRHLKDKFHRAGLTPLPSATVEAPRVQECPVNLEAVLKAHHSLAAEDPQQAGRIVKLEVLVQRIHAHESILMPGRPDHIDPDRWRPLIMSFQKFYGLTGQVHPSTLAQIPEALYRTPDMDRTYA